MKKTNLIRDEASGFAFIFLMMSSIIILCLVFVLVNQVKNLETWQNIEVSAHQTLLDMEQKGCLTKDKETALIKELSDMGVQDADIFGSTIEQTEYGEIITLKISGVVQLYANPFEENGSLYRNVPFSIEKQIVSKCLEVDE